VAAGAVFVEQERVHQGVQPANLRNLDADGPAAA
jgi:hypothetical protein